MSTAAKTMGPYALTEQERENFTTRGYVPPFDILDAESVEMLRPTFERILSGNLQSPIYDMTTHRDWHLHYRNLLTMVYRPQVINRLRSLLGDNLLVWRSSIFNKAPGDGRLEWHQSSLFAGEEYGLFKPALMPPASYEVYTDLFNVSVWIAMDDVTVENGAMQVAAGTQNKQYPVRKVPLLDSVFGRMFTDVLERSQDDARLRELSGRYACETIFDPDEDGAEVDTITMKAGQGFIFTDRVLHGSLPNTTTDRHRTAVNFRVTTPDVEVYPHRRHGDLVDGNDHDITKHACVMLAGSDPAGLNLYLN